MNSPLRVRLTALRWKTALRWNARSVADLPVRSADVVIVVGAVLAFLVVQAADAPWFGALRVVLGLAVVLFVPGYCLTAAVFPRTGDMAPVERIGLSIASSVSLVAILAPVLDRLGLGLRPASIFVGEVAVSALGLALAVFRRRRLPSPLAAESGGRPLLQWPSRRPQRRSDYVLLIMGVPLLAIGAGLVLLAPPLDSSMTEFYVLGRDDLVSDYPYQVSAGHDVRVTLGVANRAGAASTYRFEVWDLGQWGTGEGSLIQSSPPFELEPGATLERPVSWAMMSLGDDRLVEVRLFEGSDPAPARELKLWMTVSS